MVRVDAVHRTGAELGEGPCWSPALNALLWVDLHAGVLHRLDLRDDSHREYLVGQPVSAIVPRSEGFLVALRDGIAELDDLGSTVHMVKSFLPDRSLMRCNDAACDSRGRLWVGTMADDCSPGRGGVYRFTSEGDLVLMIPDTTIANGIGWSPEDDMMYFIDSAAKTIDRFAWNPDEGSIGRRSVFVDTAEWAGMPDGMAVDADGCVWVAFFGGGAVRRFTPAGRLDVAVTLPVTQVTSCAFGAGELDTLFITTGCRGLNARQRQEQPQAGNLFACHPPARGHPLTPFGGSSASLSDFS